jgi:iron complex transport system permease protein
MASCAFVAAAIGLPLVGPFALDLGRVAARQEPDWTILVHLRVSRTLVGLFAGGALSLAGTLLQAMLRDALATPYTLGISSGASLGAVIAIWAGWTTVAGVPAVWIAALGGAATVLVLVVGASVQGRQITAFGLLLSGLAANSV